MRPGYIALIVIVCLLLVALLAYFIFQICFLYTCRSGYSDFSDAPRSLPESYEPVSIPKVLHFTCKNSGDVPKRIIEHWQELNPEYELKVHADDDCRQFLMEEYGQEYLDMFNKIKHGPIKADFWRACYLAKYGGVYTDMDNNPVKPIREILDPHVSMMMPFNLCRLFPFHKTNPMFIACTPNHGIMKRIVDYYMTVINKRPYSYWRYSIVSVTDSVLESLGMNDFQSTHQEIAGYPMQFLYEGVEFKFPLREHAYIADKDWNIVLRNRDDTYDFRLHKFKE